MKATLNNTFRREVAKVLDRLTFSQRFGDKKSQREIATIKLTSWLARRFDSGAELGTSMVPAVTPDTESICEPLLQFEYDRDETVEDKITPSILGDIVEQFGSDRAKTGSYYTPALLATRICRQALETLTGVKQDQLKSLPQNERSRVAHCLENLWVIDPACGGGAFVIAMYHEYRNWRTTLEVPNGKRWKLHLYGIDIDSLAMSVAIFRLSLVAGRFGERNRDVSLHTSFHADDGLSVQLGNIPEEGFDIVVTNPPFGVQATIDQRNRFFDPKRDGVQSRDLYGLFMARSLELLRPGGVAVLLVSDTWRTIRRHLPLRKRLIQKTTVHTLVDLPPWIFNATVNTGVVGLQNAKSPNNHQVAASDLRFVPKDEWKSLDTFLDQSPDFTYLQSGIGRYDNQSVFIASPTIHRILTDNTFTTLGQISIVRQGLATGDNRRYLRKRASAHGNYSEVDSTKILTSTELESLTTDEKLSGIDRDRFAGRTIVPYDKGGASLASEGWLPNYFVPTEYFIDWSSESVARMKTATSKRQGGKIASRFQSSAQYFKQGITFSYTGFYAPCFRLSSGGVFDVGGSSCFDLQLPLYPVLAILASKLLKYIAKNYINHTVNFQVDDFKALPLPRQLDPETSSQLEKLVAQIIEKQKIDSRYPYHRNEQVEIDKIVYQLYGLSDADIAVVRAWYSKRYIKLQQSQAIEQ